MSKLTLVTSTPLAAPAKSRSSIAKAASAKDKPASPYDVRSDRVPGLLLRVQPTGKRSFYVQVARARRIRIGPAGLFTLEQAEERARAILRDPEAHHKARGTQCTLADWIEHNYAEHARAQLRDGAASIARVRAAWKPLLNRHISEITATDVNNLRNKRILAGKALSTVNRDVSALSGVFAHWAANVKGGKHPLAGFTALKVSDDETIRYLSADESKRLRQALADRDQRAAEERRSANEWRTERGYEQMPAISGYADHLSPMVLLTMNTGLRRGELFSLDWSTVDLQRKTITVKASHSKGNQTRVIPLNTEALSVLKTIKPQRATGLVFKSPITGGRFVHVKRAWAEVANAAKLPDLRWHDLRHDFASQLVMRGVPLYTVQRLLGHSNPKMTMRYAKLAPDALHDAVAVLTP